MSLKITTWNVEHARRLLGAQPSNSVKNRRRRVHDTIEEIDPDILCLVEGPRGEQGVTDFCKEVLNDQWVPVLLRGANDKLGDRDDDYQTKGDQWIWFLVKPGILDKCRLQAPAVWQSFVGYKKWTVNYWGMIEPSLHSHYRHPQVLIMDIGGGEEIELIGAHLKSKINKESITRDQSGNLTGEFLEVALKARIKLATEALDVRKYVDAKFNQVPSPGLMVMGDCNDGPGQDYFESHYLFFDLVQNLQGEVLAAERFFNHALFDFPAALRWTASFRDEILDISASQNLLLLDHILISQAIVRGELKLQVNAGAGQVEHEAYERANAGASNTTRSSDHRPVSCRLDDTQGGG